MAALPALRRIAASTWAHALLVALVALTIYGQSLNGRFVWDANLVFVEDPALGSMDNLLSGFTAPMLLDSGVDEGATGQLAYYRPLLKALHVTERALFGTDPFWFKLTNLLLHVAVGLAFHRLLLRLGASPLIAGVAALLFLVKPIHTEAVCWTYSDSYLLSAMLALATLWLLHARRRYWALAPFCAALLVHEMSILLLPTVVLFGRWMMGERRWGWLIPYLLAVVALLAARTMVVGSVPITDLPPTTLAATSAVILLRFLRIALWPDAPVTIYPLELHSALGPEGWGGVAAALVVVGLALWLWRRRERQLLFWLLFFFLWLVLSFNVGRFGQYMMAEKSLYVPSLGMSALVTLALARLAGERVAAALLLGVVLAYGVNTWQRVPHWSDTIAMVSEGLRHAPRFALGWYTLATAHADRGEYPAARHAFERVVELVPGHSRAHNNLGNIHFLEGRRGDALAAWSRAVELDRSNPRPYFNIAMTLEQMGRRPEALAYYRRYLEIAKDPHPAALRALGIVP